MATEILINDGGAPARIIPLQIHAAVAAGDPLQIHNSSGVGKVKPAATSGAACVGVALTAASGLDNMCNVITGAGVVCNVNGQGSIVAGSILSADATGKFGITAAADEKEAIALEAISGGVVKVVLL
tara:strand:+ start:99 stop:479 length:381 start_codon:yes stop_codon:yes gene_type:complete